MRPKVRKANKVQAPYPLNEFAKQVVLSVAKDFIFTKFVRGTESFEGEDWEKSFAKAINANWKPSNIGLDDIQMANCCWGAKTLKSNKPHTQKTVRLISGRNSPIYSYDIRDIKGADPKVLGPQILSIWNARVSEVRGRFEVVRTVVLMKGPGLLSGCIFEFETLRLEPERYIWKWNDRGNLEGYEDTAHRFTWQPHGSQFTMIEQIPDKRHCFVISPPEGLVTLKSEELLNSLGYKDDWVRIF